MHFDNYQSNQSLNNQNKFEIGMKRQSYLSNRSNCGGT